MNCKRLFCSQELDRIESYIAMNKTLQSEVRTSREANRIQKEALEENFRKLIQSQDEYQRLRTRIEILEREIETVIQPESFPDIPFEPALRMTQATVDWVKRAIAETGFSSLLTTAGVAGIRVVERVEDHVPNLVEGALAGVYLDVIYVEDVGYMPGWDLPGSVIHEAVHNWQVKNGLTAHAARMEVAAYMVQQVFEWRYCQLHDLIPRNLFKDRPGAIGLL